MRYGNAYLAQLKHWSAEQRAKRAAQASAAIADARAGLRARLAEWQRTLPPEAREHGLFLEDVRKAVPATLQDLGIALWELGWSRKRIWKSTGPYRRVWFPNESAN